MIRLSISTPVLLVSLLATAVLIGCVPKAQLEESQALIATCEEEKAELDAQVARWSQRFDREGQRWQDIQQSVIDTVPAALAEFDAERERILEIVPEQVQFEVGTYLDEYFGSVMQSFSALQQESRDIKLQLETTNQVLEAVGADTRSIGTAIDDALAGEEAKREQITAGLTRLHDRLVDFDQKAFNCRKCPERITLNNREEEQIRTFHAELISELTALQQIAAGATLDSTETPTNTDETADSTPESTASETGR